MSDQPSRYQDFVIRDGRLIGKFEEMYRACNDPWSQSVLEEHLDTRRAIAVLWVRRAIEELGTRRVLEVGSGLGHLSARIAETGAAVVGTDISSTAVARARDRYPAIPFHVTSGLTDELLASTQPDIIVLSEVSWYVLDELAGWRNRMLNYASERNRPTLFIHLLTTYPKGVQRHGKEFFTDHASIDAWWNLPLLETGFVMAPSTTDPSAQGTYFVARLPASGE